MEGGDKTKDKLIKKNLPKRFGLNKIARLIILIILYLAVLFSNMTTIIIQCSSKELQGKLFISEKTFGLFGTAFNIGKFLTLIMMILLGGPIRKSYLIAVLLAFAGSLIFFSLITTIYILIPIYTIIGLCYYFLHIYVILWIDRYGFFNLKQFLFSLIFVFKAGGVTCGLLMNNIIGRQNIAVQLVIEGSILFCLIIPIILFSEYYFSNVIVIYKVSHNNKIFKFPSRKKSSDSGSDDDSDFEDNNKNKINYSNDQIEQEYSLFRIRKSKDSTEGESQFQIVWSILSSQLFFFSLISSTILSLVREAFYFWSVSFLKYKLTYYLPFKESLILIAINSVGPIGSSVLHFLLSLLFNGGYYNEYTPILMLFSYCLATACGNSIKLFQDKDSLLFATSAGFFIFATAFVAFLQGVILSDNNYSKKHLKISFLLLINALIGEVPAPFIYGFILEKKNKNKFDTLSLMMQFLYIGLFFAIFVVIFKCREFGKTIDKEEEKDLQKQEEKELEEIN